MPLPADLNVGITLGDNNGMILPCRGRVRCDGFTTAHADCAHLQETTDMHSTRITLAIGAMVAGFVQGLSGFAFSMVAMSIWVWTIDPVVAAVMTVFGALTGQVLSAACVRREFSMGRLLPFLLGGLAGIPLSVFVLPIVNANLFKVLLGIVLTLWCPAMLFAAQLPALSAGGRVADGVIGIIGIIGGFMGGIGGFAGVVPTLWCTLRRFEKAEQRNVIQNFNLAMQAVTFAVYLCSGMITREMLPMFGVVAPALLIPTLLGTRLYTGISDTAFGRIVLSLLTFSGIALLSSSLPRLL